MSKQLLSWSNGVAYGEGGRVYRISHNSATGLWEVPLGKTLVAKKTTQMAAQEAAEDWETMQVAEARVMGKATKGY